MSNNYKRMSLSYMLKNKLIKNKLNLHEPFFDEEEKNTPQWLYENQETIRFINNRRFFLIIPQKLNESFFYTLKKKINDYLLNPDILKINYTYNGINYKTECLVLQVNIKNL